MNGLKASVSNGVLGRNKFLGISVAPPQPVKGQIMWKEGDEYMGDPPMEEQGLNTVFNSDKSTWKLIHSFSEKAKQNNGASNMSSAEESPIIKKASAVIQ